MHTPPSIDNAVPRWHLRCLKLANANRSFVCTRTLHPPYDHQVRFNCHLTNSVYLTYSLKGNDIGVQNSFHIKVGRGRVFMGCAHVPKLAAERGSGEYKLNRVEFEVDNFPPYHFVYTTWVSLAFYLSSFS